MMQTYSCINFEKTSPSEVRSFLYRGIGVYDGRVAGGVTRSTCVCAPLMLCNWQWRWNCGIRSWWINLWRHYDSL